MHFINISSLENSPWMFCIYGIQLSSVVISRICIRIQREFIPIILLIFKYFFKQPGIFLWMCYTNICQVLTYEAPLLECFLSSYFQCKSVVQTEEENESPLWRWSSVNHAVHFVEILEKIYLCMLLYPKNFRTQISQILNMFLNTLW